MSYEFSKIEDALQAMTEGRVVIVVDDEKRENEGDFIAAADRITPETIAFMITEGRGQLCVPIMPEQARRLEINPMVETNTAPHGCSFTVILGGSGARRGSGVRCGVAVRCRCGGGGAHSRTIRTLLSPSSSMTSRIWPVRPRASASRMRSASLALMPGTYPMAA